MQLIKEKLIFYLFKLKLPIRFCHGCQSERKRKRKKKAIFRVLHHTALIFFLYIHNLHSKQQNKNKNEINKTKKPA